MDIRIPAKQGRAFEVEAGTTFEVIASEGKQVGDLTVLARDDHTASFSSQVTTSANDHSLFRVTDLYSAPPRFLPLLKVTEDPVGRHWIHGRCTGFFYRRKYGSADHPNCHDNIVQALVSFDVPESSVPISTFNIFMRADLDRDGHYTYGAPTVEKGQSITFRAETDVLVALSSCPSDSVINDFEPKGLTVRFA